MHSYFIKQAVFASLYTSQAHNVCLAGWVPPSLASTTISGTLPVKHSIPSSTEAVTQEHSSTSSGRTEEYAPAAAVKKEELDDAATWQSTEAHNGSSTAADRAASRTDIKMDSATVKLEDSVQRDEPPEGQFEAEAMGLGALADYGSGDSSGGPMTTKEQLQAMVSWGFSRR